MNNQSYITDKADFEKAIAAVAASGKKLDKEIQRIGLSALNHNAEHKDPVYVNRLYKALASGHRKTALVQWFLTFGSLVANTDSVSKKELPFLSTKDKTTDLVAATASPWFDFAPDPAPDVVFDVKKAINGILAKIERNTQGVVEGQELYVSALRELVNDDVAASGELV